MKTKHSPGPWLYKVSTPKQMREHGSNGGANASIFRKNGKRIYGIECSDVIAYMPHWRDDAQNEEQIANTKLIAAAPDMLATLQNIVAICNNPDGMTREDILNAVANNAIPSIRKATE